MATMCKLYTDTAQTIPPETWTTVRFDQVLKDTGTMYQGTGSVADPESALIAPDQDGDFIWFRKVHWASIGSSGGGVQFIERFVRDPYETDPYPQDNDSTGGDDSNDTPGQEFNVGAWAFKGRAGQPVAIEVWHNHTSPVDVVHAQFVAMTWDY